MKSTNDGSCAKAVRFGVVQCRKYDRIIGDHPGVQVGVPITFSWNYHEASAKDDQITVDQYEIDRRQKHNKIAYNNANYFIVKTSIGSVRRLDAKQRKQILLERFQVPLTEINAAETIVQLRRNRTERLNNSIQQDYEQNNRFHILLKSRLYSPVPGSASPLSSSSSAEPSSFDSFSLSMPPSPRTSSSLQSSKGSDTRNSLKNPGVAKSLTVSQMDLIGQQPEHILSKSPQSKQQRRYFGRRQEQDMSPRRKKILLGWRKLVTRRSESQQVPPAA